MYMDMSEEIERYLGLIQLDPDNERLKANVIELYIKAGEPAKALAFAKGAAEKSIFSESILYTSINTAIFCADYDQALEWLRLFSETYGFYPWVNYNRAYCYWRKGELDRVRSELSSLPEVLKLPEAVILLARVEFAEQHLHRSAQLLQCFDVLDDQFSESQGLLSLVYFDLGQFDEAKTIAVRVLAGAPEQYEANITMATLHLHELNHVEAKKLVDTLKMRDNPSGRIFTLEGQVFLLERDYESAIQSLLQAVNLIPQHIGTWHLLGWTYLLLHQVESAKSSFLSALDIDRNFADTHGSLAVANVLLGEYQEARRYFLRAMGLNRNCHSGLFAKSLYLKAKGKDKESQQLFNHIAKAEPSLADVSIHRFIELFTTLDDER